jgi:hypothetical protein
MSWHHPDLYFFLGLLAMFAGLAASLAVIYECIQKFRRRKPPVVEPRHSTVNEKAGDSPSPPPPKYVDPPSPPKHRPSPFSRLCESMKDAPPKEQASRVREHFGIVGGARPAVKRRRQQRD